MALTMAFAAGIAFGTFAVPLWGRWQRRSAVRVYTFGTDETLSHGERVRVRETLKRGADTFDRLDEHAKRVIARAQHEAHRLGHGQIGAEHLFLGALADSDGVPARTLAPFGATLPKLRTAVEFIAGRGDGAIRPTTLSPQAKVVLVGAVDEARALGHSSAGTGHILLALLREDTGITAGALESLGVALDAARAATLRAMGGGLA